MVICSQKELFFLLLFVHDALTNLCRPAVSSIFLGDRQAAVSVSSTVNDAAIGDTSTFSETVFPAAPLEPTLKPKHAYSCTVSCHALVRFPYEHISDATAGHRDIFKPV